MQTHTQVTIRIYRIIDSWLDSEGKDIKFHFHSVVNIFATRNATCLKMRPALEGKVCSGAKAGANRLEVERTEQNAKVSLELWLSIIGAIYLDRIGYLSLTLHGDLQACYPAC